MIRAEVGLIKRNHLSLSFSLTVATVDPVMFAGASVSADLAGDVQESVSSVLVTARDLPRPEGVLVSGVFPPGLEWIRV